MTEKEKKEIEEHIKFHKEIDEYKGKKFRKEVEIYERNNK